MVIILSHQGSYNSKVHTFSDGSGTVWSQHIRPLILSSHLWHLPSAQLDLMRPFPFPAVLFAILLLLKFSGWTSMASRLMSCTSFIFTLVFSSLSVSSCALLFSLITTVYPSSCWLLEWFLMSAESLFPSFCIPCVSQFQVSFHFSNKCLSFLSSVPYQFLAYDLQTEFSDIFGVLAFRAKLFFLMPCVVFVFFFFACLWISKCCISK